MLGRLSQITVGILMLAMLSWAAPLSWAAQMDAELSIAAMKGDMDTVQALIGRERGREPGPGRRHDRAALGGVPGGRGYGASASRCRGERRVRDPAGRDDASVHGFEERVRADHRHVDQSGCGR